MAKNKLTGQGRMSKADALKTLSHAEQKVKKHKEHERRQKHKTGK